MSYFGTKRKQQHESLAILRVVPQRATVYRCDKIKATRHNAPRPRHTHMYTCTTHMQLLLHNTTTRAFSFGGADVSDVERRRQTPVDGQTIV